MGRAKQISHALEVHGEREKRQMRRRRDQGQAVHVTAPAASAGTTQLREYVAAELSTLKPRLQHSGLGVVEEDEDGQQGDEAQPDHQGTDTQMSQHMLTPHAMRVRARIERHVTNTMHVRGQRTERGGKGGSTSEGEGLPLLRHGMRERGSERGNQRLARNPPGSFSAPDVVTVVCRVVVGDAFGYPRSAGPPSLRQPGVGPEQAAATAGHRPPCRLSAAAGPPRPAPAAGLGPQ